MRTVTFAILAACGGSSDKRADPPSNQMGEAGAKIADGVKLSALTDPQKETLCDQLYVLKVPEMVMKASCLITGIGAANGTTDADLRASCKKEADACLADPKAPSAACPVIEAIAEGCGALTVGAIRACVVASGAQRTTFAGSDPCSAMSVATASDRMSAITKMMTTPECEVFTKCAVDVEGDADFQERALKPVEQFKQRVCGCVDDACAIKVDDEFRTWDALLELPTRAKPSPATEKKLKDTLDAYRACLGKLAPERNH